jgi:hypothetical protein
MSGSANTLRVVIPLKMRRRNGRPRIVPPAEVELRQGQEPNLLRALARAWKWRRQLESGAAATLHDIAAAEQVSDRFISRQLRLAYLSPAVLERLLLRRQPPALSLADLAAVAQSPWAEQIGLVFEPDPPTAEA